MIIDLMKHLYTATFRWVIAFELIHFHENIESIVVHVFLAFIRAVDSSVQVHRTSIWQYTIIPNSYEFLRG